jgi:hypothetical protein
MAKVHAGVEVARHKGFAPIIPGMQEYRGKASPRERSEVERLRGEGVSIRQTAKQVFGHERYRGRVERILQRQRSTGALPEIDDEGIDFDQLDSTALIRLLMERTLRSWAKTGRNVRATELRAMLDLQRRMEAAEQVQRLNDSTRL